MHIKNKQNGFTLVEVSILIFAISLIGLAGYLVWDRQSNSEQVEVIPSETEPGNFNIKNSYEENSNQTTDIQTNEVPVQALYVDPNTWRNFVDNDLGFSFEHPGEIGDAVSTTEESYNGKFYLVKFTDIDLLTIGSFNQDYDIGEGGRGGSFYDYSSYEKNDESYVLNTIFDSEYEANNYSLSENGNCIYSLNENNGGYNVYHGVCKLDQNSNDFTSVNFLANRTNGYGEYELELSNEDFIRIINSVQIL